MDTIKKFISRKLLAAIGGVIVIMFPETGPVVDKAITVIVSVFLLVQGVIDMRSVKTDK